jgi:hypothetical protein
MINPDAVNVVPTHWQFIENEQSNNVSRETSIDRGKVPFFY